MSTITKATRQEVIREIFKDRYEDDGTYSNDNVHWVLFENGTFYTFPKSHASEKPSGDDLVAKALEMSQEAHLLKYDDNDDVTVIPYSDPKWPPVYEHPTYMVLSCLRQRIGWIVVGESPKWAESDQQLAAVGYYARTMYEMDCHENKIAATSFPWSVVTVMEFKPVTDDPVWLPYSSVSQSSNAKPPIDRTTQRWYYQNAGFPCTMVEDGGVCGNPRACANKFGDEWKNCGSVPCRAGQSQTRSLYRFDAGQPTGCEPLCCRISPAEQVALESAPMLLPPSVPWTEDGTAAQISQCSQYLINDNNDEEPPIRFFSGPGCTGNMIVYRPCRPGSSNVSPGEPRRDGPHDCEGVARIGSAPAEVTQETARVPITPNKGPPLSFYYDTSMSSYKTGFDFERLRPDVLDNASVVPQLESDFGGTPFVRRNPTATSMIIPPNMILKTFPSARYNPANRGGTFDGTPGITYGPGIYGDLDKDSQYRWAQENDAFRVRRFQHWNQFIKGCCNGRGDERACDGFAENYGRACVDKMTAACRGPAFFTPECKEWLSNYQSQARNAIARDECNKDGLTDKQKEWCACFITRDIPPELANDPVVQAYWPCLNQTCNDSSLSLQRYGGQCPASIAICNNRDFTAALSNSTVGSIKLQNECGNVNINGGGGGGTPVPVPEYTMSSWAKYALLAVLLLGVAGLVAFIVYRRRQK